MFYLSATPFTIPDRAGNTINTARGILLSSNTTSYSDWIGTLDTNDFYSFTLNRASQLNLHLSGLNGSISLQLLDNNGNRITSITSSVSSSQPINSFLSAGTYYLRVFLRGVM